LPESHRAEIPHSGNPALAAVLSHGSSRLRCREVSRSAQAQRLFSSPIPRPRSLGEQKKPGGVLPENPYPKILRGIPTSDVMLDTGEPSVEPRPESRSAMTGGLEALGVSVQGNPTAACQRPPLAGLVGSGLARYPAGSPGLSPPFPASCPIRFAVGPSPVPARSNPAG
jgi:hypothetical protein